MACSGKDTGKTNLKGRTIHPREEHPARSTSSSVYGEDQYQHVTPGLVYIDTSCLGVGADEELFSSLPEGCDCVGGCDGIPCPCVARSKAAAQLYSAFECNSGCRCDPSCPNRVTQRGPRRDLKVVPLGKKGLGVVTERYIPQGAFVCEYAGEVIGEAEALERLRVRQPLAVSNYILFIREHISVSATRDSRIQTTVIDPTVLGNIGRYLNHSCHPNLRLVPVRVESLVPIATLFAIMPIQAGEELCYDYHSVVSTTPDQMGLSCAPSALSSPKVCLCGASICRRFLPSDVNLS